jgi:hypothetical protein
LRLHKRQDVHILINNPVCKPPPYLKRVNILWD